MQNMIAAVFLFTPLRYMRQPALLAKRALRQAVAIALAVVRHQPWVIGELPRPMITTCLQVCTLPLPEQTISKALVWLGRARCADAYERLAFSRA